MTNVKIINLSGIAFYVEETAANKLNKYLNYIHAYFAEYEDKEEIISDIENRFAEKLNDQITNPRQVATLAQIEEIIKSIGTEEDFESEKSELEKSQHEGVNTIIHAPNQTNVKKLYRSQEDKVWGGVIAGFAYYLNLQPRFLRLILSLAVGFTYLATGIGFWQLIAFIGLVYLGFYLFLPEAETTIEKIEMRGDSLTLSNIKSEISKEQESQSKERSKLVQVLLLPLVALQYLLKSVSFVFKKVVPRVFGGGIFLLGFGLILAFSFVGLAISNVKDPEIISTPFTYFPGNESEHLFIFFTTLTFVILSVILAVVGLSLFLKRNLFKVAFTLSLLGILGISIVAGLTFFAKVFPAMETDIRRREEDQEFILSDDLTNKTLEVVASDMTYVMVRPSEDGKNKLVVSGNKKAVSVNENAEKVLVNVSLPTGVCILCDDFVSITIYANNIKAIDSNASILNVWKANQKELTIKANNSVNISESQIETLTLENTYSSIYLEKSNQIQSLTINSLGGRNRLNIGNPVQSLKVIFYGEIDLSYIDAKELSLSKREGDNYSGKSSTVNGKAYDEFMKELKSGAEEANPKPPTP